MHQLIDGKALAATFRQRTAAQVADLQQSRNITPGLGVLLIGDNPASHIYVRNKEKACAEVGIYTETKRVDPDLSTAEAIALVEDYNNRDDIHGILVQLPLPDQIDATAVLHAVAPHKDADGFHPMSLGRLMDGNPDGSFVAPCTPWGVIQALKEHNISMKGANAVVVGRSLIVGKPMGMLLLHEHATVTICHSRTKDLAAVCREADILVAAVGRPHLIGADAVKDGAVVIDVGINRVEADFFEGKDLSRYPVQQKALDKRGNTIVGDVDFPEVAEKASHITPVPGGVGPLTIAMLLQNTVDLASRHAK